MWFCCQIWQCNFKTCLGSLEIWKTWNGWSHIVYPSKGNAASKTFTEFRRDGTLGKRNKPRHGTPHCSGVLLKNDSRLESTPQIQEDGKKGSRSQDDSENLAVEPLSHLISYRVPSTDLSDIEKNIDFWHQQHSHVICSQDDERHSKVRYSDRRSLEECQYRQLWSLRATLAKKEDLLSQRLGDNGDKGSTCMCTYASLEMSTDVRDVVLGQTSRVTHRHMYVNSSNSRAKKKEIYPSHSFEGNYESFDTEGYSTNTSFMDQARSFESPTDQGEDTDDGQMHRFEHHDDSGYRSIKTPPAGNIFSQQSFSDVTGRQMPSVSFELSTSDSYSSSDLEGSTKLEDISEGTSESRAGSCQDSDIHSTPSTIEINSTWDRCQRKNHCSASRRRREFGGVGGRRALAHVVSEVEYMHPKFFKSYDSIYRRDYSVDKKSDALFREFSRCDPVKMRHRQVTQTYTYSHVEHTKRLSESCVSDEDTLTTDQSEIPVITLRNDIEDDDNIDEDYDTYV